MTDGEFEKAKQIIHILDGMSVYSAGELLDKCKEMLLTTKVKTI